MLRFCNPNLLKSKKEREGEIDFRLLLAPNQSVHKSIIENIDYQYPVRIFKLDKKDVAAMAKDCRDKVDNDIIVVANFVSDSGQKKNVLVRGQVAGAFIFRRDKEIQEERKKGN